MKFIFIFLSLPLFIITALPSWAMSGPMGLSIHPLSPLKTGSLRGKMAFRQDLRLEKADAYWGGDSTTKEWSSGGQLLGLRLNNFLLLSPWSGWDLLAGIGLLRDETRKGPFLSTRPGDARTRVPADGIVTVMRTLFGEEGRPLVQAGAGLFMPISKGPEGTSYLKVRGSRAKPLAMLRAHWPLADEGVASALVSYLKNSSGPDQLGLSTRLLLKSPAKATFWGPSLSYLHTLRGLDLEGPAFEEETRKKNHPPFEEVRERALTLGGTVSLVGQRAQYDFSVEQVLWGRNVPKAAALAVGINWAL